MGQFPLKPKARKRRIEEIYLPTEPANTSAATAHLATGMLKDTLFASTHKVPHESFFREPPPHESTFQSTPFKTPPESPPTSDISVNSRLFQISSRIPSPQPFDPSERILEQTIKQGRHIPQTKHKPHTTFYDSQ